MAVKLRRDRTVRLRPEETGIIISSAQPNEPYGVRSVDYGDGWKRTTESFQHQFPYVARKAQLISIDRKASPPIPSYGLDPFITGYAPLNYSKAQNKSWEKFVERAKGDAADLGVMLGEGREAFDMVADRMIGLRNSYKALRRGDFRRFLRELSVDPKRKHRSKTRSTAAEASGLWLEYWFGWKPFCQGIYDGLTVVTGPGSNGRRRVHGTARQNQPRSETFSGSGGLTYRRAMVSEGVCFVKQGATVEVSSPNLLLLNRLGLVNPVAVAWELVPFSFVVDWFTKAGDVVNGWTDLVGLKVTNPYSTVYFRGRRSCECGRLSPPHLANSAKATYRVGTVERKASLLRPVATWPSLLNYGNSHTRAATAASLLTQIFLAK